MSNEWKELFIENIGDRFNGEYEFAWFTDDLEINCIVDIFESPERFMSVMHTLKYGTHEESGEECDTTLYYRKPNPPAPTHEEIMTKWWKVENGWYKVILYIDGRYYFADNEDGDYASWSKGTFIGRESAEIPPEVK